MTKKGSQHGLSLHQTVWSICSSTFVSAGDCQNPGSQSENNVFNVFVSRKGNLLNLLCLLLQRCHVFSSKREPDLLVLGCTKIPYPKNYGISKLVAWRSKNNPSEFHILTPCTPWKINGINCCKPENKRKVIWTKPSFPCRFELLIFLFFFVHWLVGPPGLHRYLDEVWLQVGLAGVGWWTWGVSTHMVVTTLIYISQVGGRISLDLWPTCLKHPQEIRRVYTRPWLRDTMIMVSNSPWS